MLVQTGINKNKILNAILMSAIILLTFISQLAAQQSAKTEVFWARNYQFFSYDYRVGATLQRASDYADFYVENARVISSTVDNANEVIYIGTVNGGVFKRGFTSNTWEALSDGLGMDGDRGGYGAINDLVMNSSGMLIAGTDEGIYTLGAGELRWSSRGVNVPVFDLMIDGNTVYAALGHYLWSADGDADGDIDANLGVRRSTNGGTTWANLSNGLPVDDDNEYLPVYSIASAGSGILATTATGIYRVASGEDFWQAFSRELDIASPNLTIPLQESERDEAEVGGDFFRLYYRWLTVAGGAVDPETELVITVSPPPAGVGTLDTYSQWTCALSDGILGDAGNKLLELSVGTGTHNVSGLFAQYDAIQLSNMKYGSLTGVATIINPKEEALLIVDDASDPEYPIGGQWALVTYNDGTNTYKWSAKIEPLREPNKDTYGLLLSSDTQVDGESPDYEALNSTGNLQYFSSMTVDNSATFDFVRNSISGDRLFGVASGVVYESADDGLSWTMLGDELGEDIYDLYCGDDIYLGGASGTYVFNADSSKWDLLPYVVPNRTVPTRTVNFAGTDLFVGGEYGFYTYDDAGESWVSSNVDLYEFVTADDLDNLVLAMDSETPNDPDAGIYETITGVLGADRLPDIDDDSRLSVLLHNVHDRGETWNNTSNGQEGGIDPINGYVRFADNSLLGRSNLHDMIYLDTKDGDDESRAAALAHQIVRLMMFTSDYDEERWVLESIAYIGEKLCGFELPATWVDFAQKATSSTALSLNSQWSVAPDNGSAVAELHTKVALWMTYMMENLGGIEFIKVLMDEPANGVDGIENAAADFTPAGAAELTFSDIYTSWAMACAINDISYSDPVTGLNFGYEDSSYTEMIGSYISSNADSIGLKVSFLQPDASMAEYAKIQQPSSYSEGLNNWATIYRSFFLLESTGGPKNWAGKTYHFNGADDKNFRLWMFRHKTAGGFEISELTDMLNDQNEFQFEILEKFEPSADTTSYVYDNVIIGISNQSPLGGSARFVQTSDIIPLEVQLQVLHHSAYPEFVDVYVYSNEHIHADVQLDENPVLYSVEYQNDVPIQLDAIEMEKFRDLAVDSNGVYAGTVYHGSFMIDLDAELGIQLYDTQDLSGNDTEISDVPFTTAKVTDPGIAMKMVSPDNRLEVTFPEYSLGHLPVVSLIEQPVLVHAAINKIDPAEFGNVVGMYLVGPSDHSLDRPATLKVDLRGFDTEEVPGIYLVEGKNITPVASIYSPGRKELSAGIGQLGTYLIAEKSVVSPDVVTAPDSYSLGQNYPNPFNPSTTISYSLPVSGSTVIKVYDLTGREIVTLVDTYQPAGSHRAIWNGVDAAGLQVSSGVYLYRINSGDYKNTRKMILVK